LLLGLGWWLLLFLASLFLALPSFVVLVGCSKQTIEERLREGRRRERSLDSHEIVQRAGALRIDDQGIGAMIEQYISLRICVCDRVHRVGECEHGAYLVGHSRAYHFVVASSHGAVEWRPLVLVLHVHIARKLEQAAECLHTRRHTHTHTMILQIRESLDDGQEEPTA